MAMNRTTGQLWLMRGKRAHRRTSTYLRRLYLVVLWKIFESHLTTLTVLCKDSLPLSGITHRHAVYMPVAKRYALNCVVVSVVGINVGWLAGTVRACYSLEQAAFNHLGCWCCNLKWPWDGELAIGQLSALTPSDTVTLTSC